VIARLGVAGAGAMGAGIAQLGCLAGLETVLHDPAAAALDRGEAAVRSGLAKGAERGRYGSEEAQAAAERLRRADDLDGLASCELVVEAAPERLEVKHEVFARLSEVCDERTVLATNTSSIPVTAIARAAARPERVVGMHFFNPAPVMRLVELVAAAQTGEEALRVACEVAEAMGKRAILARDGPGFLVNRCGRPFYGEALRLLEERVAPVEVIDRICRLGGGFRMGPFELMDLVGLDVSLEVTRSVSEQSFGEPRWRPSATTARLVAAGRLGRKTGRGYYPYGEGVHRAADPEPPPRGGGEGRLVVVEGEGALAHGLRDRAREAGFDARAPEALGGERPELWVRATPGGEPARREPGTPALVLCAASSLAGSGEPDACGFHLLAPLEGARVVELTRLPTTAGAAVEAAQRFAAALGLHPEWVDDAPGLVLGRMVCQLVNEAAFALGEGVGSPADIDAGLELGLNHPRGPLAWGEAIGLDHVLATLDGLWSERREERYRAAPLLRRAVAVGAGLAAVAPPP